MYMVMGETQLINKNRHSVMILDGTFQNYYQVLESVIIYKDFC